MNPMLAVWGTALPEEKHFQIILVIALLSALRHRHHYAIGLLFAMGILFKLTAIFLLPAVIYMILKERKGQAIGRMLVSGGLVVLLTAYFFRFDWLDEALSRFRSNNGGEHPIHDSVWVLIEGGMRWRGIISILMIVGGYVVFRRSLPKFQTIIGTGLVGGFVYTNVYLVSGSHDRQLMAWIPLLIFLYAHAQANRWVYPVLGFLSTIPYYQFFAQQTSGMADLKVPLIRFSQASLATFQMGNWTSLAIILAVTGSLLTFAIDTRRGDFD